MERLPNWKDPGEGHPLRPLVLAYLAQRDVALTADRLRHNVYVQVAEQHGIPWQGETLDVGDAIRQAMTGQQRSLYEFHGQQAQAYSNAAGMTLRAMEQTAHNLGGW
jgi:hypothetical protein